MRYITRTLKSNNPVWTFCNQEYVDNITDVTSLANHLRGYAYCTIPGRTTRVLKVRDLGKASFLPMKYPTAPNSLYEILTIDAVNMGYSLYDYYAYDRGAGFFILIDTQESLGSFAYNPVGVQRPLYGNRDLYTSGIEVSSYMFRLRFHETDTANRNEIRIKDASYTPARVGMSISSTSWPSNDNGTFTSGCDLRISSTGTPRAFNDACRAPYTSDLVNNTFVTSDPTITITSVSLSFVGTQFFPKSDQVPVASYQVVENRLVKHDPSKILVRTDLGEYAYNVVTTINAVTINIKV